MKFWTMSAALCAVAVLSGNNVEATQLKTLEELTKLDEATKESVK